MDYWQVSFVTLEGFFPWSKYSPLSVFNDNINLGWIATKIKRKMHALYTKVIRCSRHFFYFLLFCISFNISTFYFSQLFRISFNIIWKKIFVSKFRFLTDSRKTPLLTPPYCTKCDKRFLSILLYLGRS